MEFATLEGDVDRDMGTKALPDTAGSRNPNNFKTRAYSNMA